AACGVGESRRGSAARQSPVMTCRGKTGGTVEMAFHFSPRRTLIIAHDLVMTAAAIVASFYIRFEAAGLMEREKLLLLFLPGFVAYAGVVYYLFHLYEAKWRVACV